MKKKNTHISEEDFRRYLENRMSEAGRNRFERELQKHPFEAEAMEGYENTSADLKQDVEEIKDRISKRKRKNTYRYWAAAASVVLLIAAGLIWYQLGDEPPTPDMAVLKTEEWKKTAPVITDSVTEKSAVSKPEETEENTAAEPQQQQQQQQAAEVAEPESGKQKTKEKQMAQNHMPAKNRKEKSARDTKTVSGNLTAGQAASKTQLKLKSLTNTENGTIELTERVEFPIDSNDIFPDSFQTIPAEEREKVQEIQGVAGQDNVEVKSDAYLEDIEAHPNGGMENLMNYIEKQAALPESYSQREKTVELLLEIDNQGNIIGIHNRNKADSLLFERSKKIIRNGPKWNPEVVNGEKVRSEVKLKMDFKKR
ncbi:MAG: hypothetical protein ACOC1D_00330 [Prolixibacteraceae bacterium]